LPKVLAVLRVSVNGAGICDTSSRSFPKRSLRKTSTDDERRSAAVVRAETSSTKNSISCTRNTAFPASLASLNLREQGRLGAVLEEVLVLLCRIPRLAADGDVRSRRHGHRGGGGLADEQPSLGVLVLELQPGLTGHDHPIGLDPVGVGLVPSREYAVLDVQRGVHVLAGSAGARLQEALLKVVAQEGVEDRIHRAVAVTEEAGQQEAGDGDVTLALLRWRIDQRHLGDPVR